MNYEEAKIYLDNVAKYGIVLGLGTMRELLGRLGNPQDDLKFIHIAGTNGKGSVLTFLSTVLQEAGYRVGRYISPALTSYRELIQVDGDYIDEASLARLTTEVRRASEDMEKEGLNGATVFEMETAIAFLYFKEKACDLVALETGMGGRDDATNVVTTTVMEIFTSISLEHVGVLGNNLQEIAECKAGIIKEGTSVVSTFQKPEAAEILKTAAGEKNCSFYMVNEADIRVTEYGYDRQKFDYQDKKDILISLAGEYQIENGALAAEAVKVLKNIGYEIPDKAFYEGMKKAVWKGRFTVLLRDPLLIIDGAHNEDGARELAKSIERYFRGKKISYIMGVFKDKDYEKIIRITAPYAGRVTAVETPGNPRALPKEELKKAWEKQDIPVETADTIQDAVRRNLELADKEEVIIAFGSLSFLGEMEKAVKAIRR